MAFGGMAVCFHPFRGAHEFLDAPTGLRLDVVADGQGSEHDGQVRCSARGLLILDLGPADVLVAVESVADIEFVILVVM
jgi:hypothetical protein